jgi:hypothetical protein
MRNGLRAELKIYLHIFRWLNQPICCAGVLDPDRLAGPLFYTEATQSEEDKLRPQAGTSGDKCIFSKTISEAISCIQRSIAMKSFKASRYLSGETMDASSWH